VPVSVHTSGTRDDNSGAGAGLAAVLVEVGLERELSPAARALVVLGRGVGLDVRAQVGPVGERLAAVSAAERPLTGVRALMTAQQPRPRERLVTHRAPVPAPSNPPQLCTDIRVVIIISSYLRLLLHFA